MILTATWIAVFALFFDYGASRAKPSMKGLFEGTAKFFFVCLLALGVVSGFALLMWATAAGSDSLDEAELAVYVETYETSDDCELVETSLDQIESYWSARRAEEQISNAFTSPFQQNEIPENPISDSEKYDRLAEVC